MDGKIRQVAWKQVGGRSLGGGAGQWQCCSPHVCFCVFLQVELEGSTMTAVKPKMFLTCSMVLERDQWVKLA